MLIFLIVHRKTFAKSIPIEKEGTSISQTFILGQSSMETTKALVQTENKTSLANDFENRLKENQIFYGTWRIVDMVSSDDA